MIGNLLRKRRCREANKCVFGDIEKYWESNPSQYWNLKHDRWGVIVKSLALTDQLKREYGYQEGGHLGLMSGTCFKIYSETDEHYVGIVYNLIIPAYKFCVQIIERPLPSVINYFTTSFDYLDEIDGRRIDCHKHLLEIKTVDGEEVHIK